MLTDMHKKIISHGVFLGGGLDISYNGSTRRATDEMKRVAYYYDYKVTKEDEEVMLSWLNNNKPQPVKRIFMGKRCNRFTDRSFNINKRKPGDFISSLPSPTM